MVFYGGLGYTLWDVECVEVVHCGSEESTLDCGAVDQFGVGLDVEYL